MKCIIGTYIFFIAKKLKAELKKWSIKTPRLAITPFINSNFKYFAINDSKNIEVMNTPSDFYKTLMVYW